MADEADIANDFIDSAVSRALGKIRQAPTKPGSKFCVNCEENIPEARRKLGFELCIECAEESERRGSQYADY